MAFRSRKPKEEGAAEMLRAAFPDMPLSENVSMAELCSLRCGGRAAAVVQPRSAGGRSALLARLGRAAAPPYVVLGNGTNTLFGDGLYPGVVIRIAAPFSFCRIEENILPAGAGTLLVQAAREACRAGFSSLAFATGIPGSVGGAIFMNAGAYGGEIGPLVESVTTVSPSGEIRERGRGELHFSYRHSALMDSGEIALSARLALIPGKQEEIDALVRALSERRAARQPLSLPSAGSFFKRPAGHFAGELIERAGLKGLSLGGAQISPLHAGFIVNTGNATASDVIDLMKVVQETVLSRCGVLLEPEVRIVEH